MIGLALAAALVATGPVWVGRFSVEGAPPPPWRVVRVGKATPTVYRVTTVARVRALEARADGAMALLARPVAVDLAATPIPTSPAPSAIAAGPSSSPSPLTPTIPAAAPAPPSRTCISLRAASVARAEPHR